MATNNEGGRANVVAINDAARELTRRRRLRSADPPPHMPRGADKNVLAGQWTAGDDGLPIEEPCPVKPLGRLGRRYFLLDSSGSLVELGAADFTHAGIQSLFASAPNYPEWAWPRYGKGKEGEAPPIKSFDDDRTRKALLYALDYQDPFDPRERVRGRGGWLDEAGRVLYHAGVSLWVCEGTPEAPRFRDLFPGVHGRYLYPLRPPLPSPWSAPVTVEDNPARELLLALRKWNWERPAVDPILLLGWIGVAFLGGALDWRPAVMLTGDKGTGKSTLQEALKAIFGEALFASADTTAAGIYQALGQDTRPVAIDEMEPTGGTGRGQGIVTLMRDAASGSEGSRGGASGQASSFQMRSAFLFSAINNPITDAQDLSRVAVLRLKKLPDGQTQAPPIDTETAGRKVLARIMAQWPRFAATFEAFAAALGAGGHDGRGQKTYGYLLTCAELLLGPELAAELEVPLSEDPRFWSENLAQASLPEAQDAKPNWAACIDWLMEATLDTWRNAAMRSIGQCLHRLVEELPRGADADYLPTQAVRDLATVGVGLLDARELNNKRRKLLEAGETPGFAELAPGWVLAVPNSHAALAPVFDGTQWETPRGRAGIWRDALRQAPADVVITCKHVNKVSIGGSQPRCSLIVLDAYRKVTGQ